MSKPLWTSAEMEAATGGQASAPFNVAGLSIDTRSLEPGELFVALKDQRDGHEFAANAFAAGAAGALVSQPVDGAPTLMVPDVLQALEALGLAARDRAPDCYRVAVTGSVGKTSVKEMLARIFRARGPAHWNVRSFNNQWGVPLTLARMPAETSNAVFEIGMNTPGEIAPRSAMVAPQAAMITKIAPAHLEGVGSIEGVAKEKSDIFAGLQAGGFVILPAEDDYFRYLADKAKAHQSDCQVLTFGFGKECDARVHQIYSDGATLSVYIFVHGQEVNVELNAMGNHWAVNAAAALLAACPTPSDDVFAAAEALSGYAPPPGRGTAERLRLPGGEITLIDDAYNANPESMRAALLGFAARPASGARIAVLGEMKEIGPTSVSEHAALAEPLIEAGVEKVFLAGADMRVLVDSLGEQIESVWAPTANDLQADLISSLKAGDLVLLKGSNASGIGKLADRLREVSAAADQHVMDRGLEEVARGSDAV